MTAFIKVRAGHVATFGPTVAIVYSQIIWRSEQHPDGWRASYALLAEETGLPQRTVRRCCAALREQNVVAAERATSDDATLVWTVVSAGQPKVANVDTSEVADLDTPPGQSGHLPEMADLATSSLETVETEQTPPTTPPDADEQQALPLLSVVASPPASGVDEEFAGFWNAYPRKVAKQAALRAYRAARKVASLEAIAAGLRAQLPDLRTRDSHLIPHAATWLNQHRWEDDPRAAAQPRGGPRNYDLERMQARAAGVAPEITTGATAMALQMLEARR